MRGRESSMAGQPLFFFLRGSSKPGHIRIQNIPTSPKSKIQLVMRAIQDSFQEKIRIRQPLALHSLTLDPSTFSIACHLPTPLLLSAHKSLYPQLVSQRGKLLQLADFCTQDNKQSKQRAHKQVVIRIGTQKSSLLGLFEYKCWLEERNLILAYSAGVTLSFTLTLKPKFVKNQILQDLLQGGSDQLNGVVSMDQMGRLLLEAPDCQFPVLGVWMCCDSLDTIDVYSEVSRFLHSTEYKEKILINIGQQSYVYFVKVNGESLPECYLVSWKQKSSVKETAYPVTSDHILMCLGSDCFQFTLRAPQERHKPSSVMSTAQNFASPSSKEMSNEDFIAKLEQFHLAESPQFSSIKKTKFPENWEQECYYLRNKVESQSAEISTLKLELDKLRKELLSLKHPATSDKPPICFHSPMSSAPSSSKPPLKKLSESDLYIQGMKSFNSNSTREKKSENQGSSDKWNSVGTGQKEQASRGIVEDEPWDNIELVEEDS